MYDVTLELSIVKTIEGIDTNNQAKAIQLALKDLFEFNGLTLDEALATGLIEPKVIEIKKYEVSDVF